MITVPVFVGLDYHQGKIQTCILDAQGRVLANRPLVNDAAELDAFVRRYGTPSRAAIEACTGSAALCDELATQWQWDIRQAHPGFVKRMAAKPDKTDFGDARILADLVRLDWLPEVWLAPPAIRDLKRVTRYRQQLVDQRRAEKLRVRALLRECRVALEANPWTQAWCRQLKAAPLPEQAAWVVQRHMAAIARLTAEIAEIEARLTTLVADDAGVAKLRQQKGIGLVTAAVLRAEIGVFDRFRTGKQLSRYCGLTPRNASSGDRQADAGLVQAGSTGLRTVLIEAAHRLTRLDPRWKQFKTDLQARGKSGSVIAAAVANRWVRGLLHQMKPATTPAIEPAATPAVAA